MTYATRVETDCTSVQSDQGLHWLLTFMYVFKDSIIANSVAIVKTARMRMLVWVYAGCIYDKVVFCSDRLI